MFGRKPKVTIRTVTDTKREQELEAQLLEAQTQTKRNNEEHEFAIKKLGQEQTLALDKVKQEQETKIAEETAKLNKDITELTIKFNAAEAENNLLTKAFENMGFDVKDMKGILDKLVDGLISKNEIKVIK